jgi:DNA-binding response OmpR family regulator
MKTNMKKILHVDDESDTLQVVKTILEKEGFSVDGVESGKVALEKIKVNNYDLMLLDIMMPDMSGWDLFNRILAVSPDFKVIFLTVLEISESRLKELKAHGVKDYITKPFDKDDLVKRINKAMSASQNLNG